MQKQNQMRTSAQKRRNGRQPNIYARYIALALSFVIICIVYAVILFIVQFQGWLDPPVTDDKNIREVTVAGLRGEIYDCNGKLLVGNSTSFNLLYEYGAMPYTRKEINAEILALDRAIKQTGNEKNKTASFFPFEGSYPDLTFSSELSDKDSDTYFYLYNRVLSDNKLDEDITAEELLRYYERKYNLKTGGYTDAEVDILLRYLYEMERCRFGAFQAYTIAENVTQDLINYVEEAGISGATFTTMSERVYYYPGIASHILGQVGKIHAEDAEYYSDLGYPMNALVGKSGCEEAFESYLHGQDGTMVIKYDDKGNIVEKYYKVEPISGNDVYLTIDIDLQIAAEKGLAENIAAIEGTSAGAVTAVDAKTGAVLALASYPTYDLTLFGDQEYIDTLNNNTSNPWLNRALSGVYAPGSTYKIGVALAALEENKIDLSTTYTCNKVFPHYHQPTCLGYHNTINIVEAIKESCNVFFYYVGELMGMESINKYTKQLGLGTKTGIELGEKAGSIAGPQYANSWGKGEDLSGAIGQSDHGYTPLQLSVYMSTIVNKGTRYRAYLLDSVRKFYTGEVVYSQRAEVMNVVEFGDDTYEILMEGMRQVVAGNDTLTRNFRNLPVTVGGKTGTAEVSGKRANGLFTGFAPFDDPEIVVTCIIEEGEAGSRASTAVARVMEEYFKEDVE